MAINFSSTNKYPGIYPGMLANQSNTIDWNQFKPNIGTNAPYSSVYDTLNAQDMNTRKDATNHQFEGSNLYKISNQTNAPATATVPTSTFAPTNNMGMINDANKQALDATIASIKAAVQQAKNKQQQVIDQAAPTYQNLKNTVFNQSLAGLPSMQENLANLGASTQGGLSRTEQTRANSDLQNKLGALDIEKQNVINQANATIADLEAKGMFDEANATKEAALNKLQQILAESGRLDTLNYQVGRDTVGDSQWKQTFDYNAGQDATKNNQWTQAFNREGEQWNKTFDYNANRDTVADNQWNKTFDYNAGQDEIKNDQWTKTFNENVRQFDETFDYNAEQDKVKGTQWEKQFNEGVRQFNESHSLQERELALQKMKAATSSASAKSSLDSQDIINNIYKQYLGEGNYTTTTTTSKDGLTKTVIVPNKNVSMDASTKASMAGKIQNYLSAYSPDSPEFQAIVNAGLGLGLTQEQMMPANYFNSKNYNTIKGILDTYGNSPDLYQRLLGTGIPESEITSIVNSFK